MILFLSGFLLFSRTISLVSDYFSLDFQRYFFFLYLFLWFSILFLYFSLCPHKEILKYSVGISSGVRKNEQEIQIHLFPSQIRMENENRIVQIPNKDEIILMWLWKIWEKVLDEQKSK